MSDVRTPPPHNPYQQAGIIVFVLLCGLPALEMNGFGFGLALSLPIALACAAIGGAVGGALMCPRPMAAGIAGGLLAGPLGLVAVYFYTRHRVHVANFELVVVQGIACLPGLGLAVLLKRLLGGLAPATPAGDDARHDH